MMRTSNPALNAKVFQGSRAYGTAGTMTIQGTVNKSFVLLALLVMSASWVWGKVMQPVVDPIFGGAEAAAPQIPAAVGGAIMFGLFGGMIAGFVTIFKKEWAAVTGPIYAVLEGLFIGGISAFFEMRYPGIVIQAVGLTFGTLFWLYPNLSKVKFRFL